VTVESNPAVTGLMPDNFGPWGRHRVVKVTIPFTSATWNTVATHEVFTVTGVVRAMCIFHVTSSLTSGGAATISFGLQTAGTSYAAAQTYTNLTTGNMVSPGGTVTTGIRTYTFLLHQTNNADLVISEDDIGYAIASAALTGGTIDAYCFWAPVSEGGLVVAGAGGAL